MVTFFNFGFLQVQDPQRVFDWPSEGSVLFHLGSVLSCIIQSCALVMGSDADT